MRMMFVTLLAAGLALCAVTTPNGWRQPTVFQRDMPNAYTDAEDAALAEEYLRNFEFYYQEDHIDTTPVVFVSDEVVVGYVWRLVAELAAAIPPEWNVQGCAVRVVDVPDRNIYSMAGCTVVFTLREIALWPSEDYARAAISHEMGHIAMRHSTASLTRQRAIQEMLHMVYQEVMAEYDKNPRDMVRIRLLHDLYVEFQQSTRMFLKIGIQNERLADRFAVYLCYRAGCDPLELADGMERMAVNLKVPEGYVPGRDHPLLRDRAEDIRQEALALRRGRSWPRQKRDISEFRRAVRRARELAAVSVSSQLKLGEE